jgi:magnesium transporter
MNKITKYRTKKTGLAPGSLVHFGNHADTKIRLSLMDYNEKEFIEKNDITMDECLKSLNTPLLTWINIQGIHDSTMIQTIGTHFGLHPLMLDDYKENIFIVMRMLNYNDAKAEVSDEQVSIILGKNYVISFIETDNNIFESIRQNIRKDNSRVRKMGADYLCYSLMDCIVDKYFNILEQADQKLEDLETELVKNPRASTLLHIQKSKREISMLRKSVWPTREVVSQLRRLETPLIQDATKLYMQDVYDHTIQAIDTIENFRDISSGMLDIYLSNLSARMNEVMKVLTIVSTIFVPLTFITSLYGMNFQEMPELSWKYGYYVTLFVMLMIALGMIAYFRRKKWI